MEVHHHPQLHHEKKPWKEYLLEFLMIFLAVTMGFFAETMRENITESSHAKELAKSLYQEVFADSVAMQAKLKIRLEKEQQMEYYMRYVSDSSLTNLSDKFYPASAWSFIITTTNLFEPNDGVMSQSRNSGSMRYIKSINVQNCMSRLNVIISNLRERNNQELNFVNVYTRPLMLRHFDFKWEAEYTQHGKLPAIDALAQTHFHPSTPPFIRHAEDFNRQDVEALTAYYLLIVRASRQVVYLTYVKANHELLEALRKTYHFDKE